MDVRDFERSDSSRVLELLSQHWRVLPLEQGYLDTYLANSNHPIVAIERGTLIAFLNIHIVKKLTWGGCSVAQIEDVIVHHKHRGRRVGLVLLRHALEKARQLNCFKATLSCTDDVTGFYARCGFEPHETNLRLYLSTEKLDER